MAEAEPTGCGFCGAPRAEVCCLVAGPATVAVCCRCIRLGLAILRREEPRAQPEILPWLFGDLLTHADAAAAERLVAAAAALALPRAALRPPPRAGQLAASTDVWCSFCGIGRRLVRMISGQIESSPLRICAWCLVASAVILRETHRSPAVDVLWACVDELPGETPPALRAPWYEALHLLDEDDGAVRAIANHAGAHGCYAVAASTLCGLRGAAREPADTIDEAVYRHECGEHARARALLASLDGATLAPELRAFWLCQCVFIALETRDEVTAAEIARWHEQAAHLAAIDAGEHRATVDDYLAMVRGALAIFERDAGRAEALFDALPRLSVAGRMRLGDLIQRRDEAAARAHYEKAVAACHPASWYAAELRRRLDTASPTPSQTPYR